MASDKVTQDEVMEKVRQRFRDFLMHKQLRQTNQRMAILDAAFGMERHWVAEQLLEAARRLDRSVSRATVYRSIPLMVEGGFLREIDVGRDHKFYVADASGASNHVQIVCVSCDRIFEVDAPFMGWYAQSVAQKVGLKAESIRLQIVARCEDRRRCEHCEAQGPECGGVSEGSHAQV
jgi:Fur family transcriptional regulator, ferric uptake regulator